MTKEEFIKTCTLGGYCSRRTAAKYSEDKDKLTGEDIINVYRKEQNVLDFEEGRELKFRSYGGAKTTKRLHRYN